MSTKDLQERLPGGLDDVEFEDRLEVVGLATGAFLVLVGLGTLVGIPFTPTGGVGVALVQALGALGTVAVGVGLAWLVRTQR